jgi:hypothetical protein
MRKNKDLRFTKGDANRIADRLIHPHFSEGIGVIILDGLVHAAIEGNPQRSLKKFLQYNLRPLTKELKKRGEI